MTKTLVKNGSFVSEAGLLNIDLFLDGPSSVTVIHRETEEESPVPDTIIDATGLLIFPGFIDCHVHFREPGFPHKATMKSEAASALAGGVTTVCEMPNTNPPTVTVAALADKVRRAANVDLDIRFFFGVTEEIHLQELVRLWTSDAEELQRLKARCSGVKVYLDHSTGNQKVESSLVPDIFKACAEHGIPLVAHCEDPDMNAAAKEANTRTDIAAHSDMRPAESEAKAIAYAIGLAKQFGTPLHVAHLSTKQGAELVAKAKQDDVTVTCEVAPHHLFLSTDDYPELGTLMKMNPPIRTKDHVEALWQGIADGTIDCIATDHAPHTLEEKRTDPPLNAPSGVQA